MENGDLEEKLRQEIENDSIRKESEHKKRACIPKDAREFL